MIIVTNHKLVIMQTANQQIYRIQCAVSLVERVVQGIVAAYHRQAGLEWFDSTKKWFDIMQTKKQ